MSPSTHQSVSTVSYPHVVRVDEDLFWDQWPDIYEWLRDYGLLSGRNYERCATTSRFAFHDPEAAIMFKLVWGAG